MTNYSKAIKIAGLSKSYHDKLVINNIDLEINPNQIFALIGLNGQGKTSLIKSLLNLVSFDSGHISIYGKSSIDPNSRKDICYLPEKFSPSSDLKGIEFLKFNCQLHKVNFDLKHLQELCHELDLKEESLLQKVTSYSKGMVQKLGLISVFLTNANLIILDEPMSGLDPKARKNLKDLLVKFAKNKGKTIFFTSHILSDIEEICSDMAIIHDTKIRYCGSVKDFSKNKGKDFEEKFLNII